MSAGRKVLADIIRREAAAYLQEHEDDNAIGFDNTLEGQDITVDEAQTLLQDFATYIETTEAAAAAEPKAAIQHTEGKSSTTH